MVNQFRTLLLNLDGAGFVAGPGEAYADPAYRAVAGPPELVACRAALFGPAPDRATVLGRGRQYLELVHASWLAPFATADDPRVTYLPLPAATRLAAPPGGWADLPRLPAALDAAGIAALFAPDAAGATLAAAYADRMQPVPDRVAAACLAVAAATALARGS